MGTEMNSNGGQREVDRLARDVHSWWGKTFLYMKTTKVRTWKGALFLAFFAGITAALGWSVSMDVHTGSKAAGETATLALSSSAASVAVGGTFNVEILLDTNGSNAVAAKANVSYNPQYFELQSWTTDTSVFATGNQCVFNSKPCEVVSSNPAQGTISITVAKPTPGVNDEDGIVGVLTFTALAAVTPSTPNITIDYNAQGGYADSDVIFDDGLGTDILSGVSNAAVTVTAPTCTSFTYSAWGACQPNGSQSRTVATSSPGGCAGGSPVLTQSCTYVPPTCTSFTYSAWGACQPDDTQSRTVATSSPGGCAGGSPVLTQSCTYDGGAETCTSFTYSAWGACQPNNTQSRTVATSSPGGCSGGSPLLSQACTYTPPAVTCTDFTYSAWGACQPNSTQSRTVATSLPGGCAGGSPVLSQACTYNAGGGGGGGGGGSSEPTISGTGTGNTPQPSNVPTITPVTLTADGKQYTLTPAVSIKTKAKKFAMSGTAQNMSGGTVWIYEVKKNKGTLIKKAAIDAAGNWTTSLKYTWKKKRYYRFAYYNAAGEMIQVSDIFSVQTGGKKK